MSLFSTSARIAAAVMATGLLAAPMAHAGGFDTRTTVVEAVTLVGAITDDSAPKTAERADTTTPALPVVYEDATPAAQAQSPTKS